MKSGAAIPHNSRNKVRHGAKSTSVHVIGVPLNWMRHLEVHLLRAYLTVQGRFNYAGTFRRCAIIV